MFRCKLGMQTHCKHIHVSHTIMVLAANPRSTRGTNTHTNTHTNTQTNIHIATNACSEHITEVTEDTRHWFSMLNGRALLPITDVLSKVVYHITEQRYALVISTKEPQSLHRRILDCTRHIHLHRN